MKPHPIIISLLTRVEDVIPKWKIVPTKDVIDSAFKDPVKREEVSVGHPDLGFVSVLICSKNMNVATFSCRFVATS